MPLMLVVSFGWVLAGRSSSQDGWRMMLLMLVVSFVSLLQGARHRAMLAHDATDACRIFHFVAAGRPSSRDAGP